ALRADLQGFRVRLLPDRPDAVCARRGAGVQLGLGLERPRRSARRRAPGGVLRAVSFVVHIAILTDDPGWHGRRLARALGALEVKATFAFFSDCAVDLEANRWGVVVPGFDARLPG